MVANNGDSWLCIFEPNVRFPEKPRPKKQEGRKTSVGAISKHFLLSHDSVAYIEYTYKTVVALGRRVFAIFGPVIASNDRVALPFDRSDYVVLGKLCKQRDQGSKRGIDFLFLLPDNFVAINFLILRLQKVWGKVFLAPLPPYILLL